jgi:hypothetical protein
MGEIRGSYLISFSHPIQIPKYIGFVGECFNVLAGDNDGHSRLVLGHYFWSYRVCKDNLTIRLQAYGNG